MPRRVKHTANGHLPSAIGFKCSSESSCLVTFVAFASFFIHYKMHNLTSYSGCDKFIYHRRQFIDTHMVACGTSSLLLLSLIIVWMSFALVSWKMEANNVCAQREHCSNACLAETTSEVRGRVTFSDFIIVHDTAINARRTNRIRSHGIDVLAHWEHLRMAFAAAHKASHTKFKNHNVTRTQHAKDQK